MWCRHSQAEHIYFTEVCTGKQTTSNTSRTPRKSPPFVPCTLYLLLSSPTYTVYSGNLNCVIANYLVSKKKNEENKDHINVTKYGAVRYLRTGGILVPVLQ